MRSPFAAYSRQARLQQPGPEQARPSSRARAGREQARLQQPGPGQARLQQPGPAAAADCRRLCPLAAASGGADRLGLPLPDDDTGMAGDSDGRAAPSSVRRAESAAVCVRVEPWRRGSQRSHRRRMGSFRVPCQRCMGRARAPGKLLLVLVSCACLPVCASRRV
jgi:hypothetical protein